jgi:hypothetical protein
MKKIHLMLLVGAVLLSCSKKDRHEEPGDWRELESFHKVMAAIYHPLKDSGNLAPAKRRIAQLAAEAEKWSVAAVPERVNTPEMKEKLQKLKADAKTLAMEIERGAPDAAIREKIVKLHDQFHEIMEAWMSKGEKHHKNEDDD